MNQDEPTRVEQSSDTENLLTSFSYPLCKGGLALLLAVGIINVGLQLLQNITRFLPMGNLLSGILQGMLGGSILGYVLHIITKTADGLDTPPDWQDISGWSDILRPTFLLLGAAVISFGPTIGWSVASHYGYVEMRPVFWILLLWGCFYFPMALTAVAMMDSFRSFNPVLILVSIFRTGWLYLYTVILLSITAAVTYCLTGFLSHIPYLSSFLGAVLLMYLLMVTGRVCGLIYRLRREKLNWLCE